MRYFIQYSGGKAIAFQMASSGPIPNMTEVSEETYEAAFSEFISHIPQDNNPQEYYLVLSNFRSFREKQFAAFDIYKSNVEYGIISESSAVHNQIVSWYQTMLAFPETITLDNYNKVVFPETPVMIQPYVN